MLHDCQVYMSKRKRFVITSLILSLGFIGIGFMGDQYKFYSIAVLGALSVALFSWSLREGLSRNMTLLTLILPLFFTLGVGLFWFLLPRSLFAQVPIVLFYGIGIYALCLTSNIYTVSTIRTIALMRAARGVGFVLTLITLFLVYDAILSVKINYILTGGLVFLLSFPLFLQGFWTVVLEESLQKEVLLVSLISSMIMGELSLGLYFWPVTVVVGSLFLTVAGYVLLGLGQAKLEGRLFTQTVREYLILGSMVFLAMFLATYWS